MARQEITQEVNKASFLAAPVFGLLFISSRLVIGIWILTTKLAASDDLRD